ncbi:uncharacterized protein JN550_002572 [Neoarthrinium moseri]|uniref:uncharacterized protein n=1 Tax=Neoarthrinium moseri TaxID=1658444 RepID=UPI001FDCB04C|nr:uncharacterized protein JN550_002572 [Neoarthrinium moseri]KAI1873993.1 hypothetical protein JN550_002572 [Neoarthrinium moseri]
MAKDDLPVDSWTEHVPEASTSKTDQHIEGNALLVDKHGKVRRLPVPSSDPNDPLNWKRWEKYAVIFCCCWFSVMSLALAGGLGAILDVFFALYGPQGYDASDITLLLTLPSLCIGLGNYIILPLSLAFGRRPIFLVSTVILLGATIGAAAQDSYNGHLTARVIQGLATGASESLLPLMLTEVTFLHERGQVFGLYWMTQSIFSSLLNLASSYEAAALGWRWYYWIFAITVAAGLVFAVFGAFETKFSRPATSLDGCVCYTDEFGVAHVIPDNEAQEFLDRMGIQLPDDNAAETPRVRTAYGQKLKPWSKPHPQPARMVVMSWVRMASSLTSPAILYAVLISSIALACSIDISLTYNTVLLGYGWQPKDIGLINLGAVVGALIGTAYCSTFGEWLVIRMAKRNRGVHKPEHRLLVLVIPGILGIAMLVMYGYTAVGAKSYWGAVLGWTFFQTTFVCVLIVSTTFAAEAYPKHPGPALVVVVGTKNVVSFGATFGFTPLMASLGSMNGAFNVLAGIFGAIFVLGLPVYVFNPRWREKISQMEHKRGVEGSD